MTKRVDLGHGWICNLRNNRTMCISNPFEGKEFELTAEQTRRLIDFCKADLDYRGLASAAFNS